MNQEQAKEYIRHNANLILKRDKSGKGFICPICGSGSGRSGTGITTKDGVHYTCWGGDCFKNSDIIEIVGVRDGLTEYREQLEAACREAGITLDGATSYRQREEDENTMNTQGAPQTVSGDQPQEVDYTAYYAECHSRIGDTGYLAQRGISNAELLERFNIGFDPAWKHPKVVAEGKNAPATPRIIIPTSSSSYFARDTRNEDEMPEYQQGYTKSKVGRIHIFNLEALRSTDKPIFVVEGEIDALSIMDVGGNALALGSTSNAKKLLEELERGKPLQPIILALDNDEAGEKATSALAAGMEQQGITFYRRNPCGSFKDANEALQKDREGFRSAVEAAINAGQEEGEEYQKTSNASYLQSFINGIAESVNTPCISTGFKILDEILDGGLYEGLYVMGAISSLGKTSLAIQICDQVAAAGTDVLIFSLEMARTELMAKSISRHSFIRSCRQYARDGYKANRLAKTGRGITDGRRYVNYSQEEQALIKGAIGEYEEYAEHVFISEGIGDIGVCQIRERIEQHIRITGRKPFVLVDYLQIIAPYNERATDKQNTDKAVLELKRISRDFKLSVLAISSLNRMNYNSKISMEAFKESGAIEYSADCLIGLQLEGIGDHCDVTEEKKKDPRKIELIILKNRNGKVGVGTKFDYYPRFSFFEEA